MNQSAPHMLSMFSVSFLRNLTDVVANPQRLNEQNGTFSTWARLILEFLVISSSSCDSVLAVAYFQ